MRLITNESVSFGHPDKIADQISDAILDAILSVDKDAKVAVEAMVKDNCVILGGEVTAFATVDYNEIVREVVKIAGYNNPEHGFYWKNLTIINFIGKQSREINDAVELNDEIGAGDQGFMTGYATNETDTYMPIGCYISKKIVDFVTIDYSGFGPDAKTQVTIEENDKKEIRVHTILVSTMHDIDISLDDVRKFIKNSILNNNIELPENIFNLIDENTNIVVNPAGSWHVGGPVSDCGVTGRKIVVDQYGPYCPVGGGAYSGKDGTKVDRSGSYLCRYIAKNIVAAGIARKCKVEIAYMIGVKEPASLNIDTFGDYINDEKLTNLVKTIFPLTPKQIINHFGLNQPIYFDLAHNGHYGRNHLPWEKLDMVDKLKNLI